MWQKTKDCYWYRRLGGIIYQWASSRLFIPRGDNVFPLCIKWASRAFLTASRLLRMSSSGIRVTSLIECLAWLKCKETGVGSLSCWWSKMDRQCSPDRSFSWRLVSPMYWHLHLTNQSIKIGRRAWPTRDLGKKRPSPPVFLNNWLNFRVRG